VAELEEAFVLSIGLREIGPRSGEGDFEIRDDLDPIVALNGYRSPADQAGEPAGDGRDPSGIE